MKKNKTKIISIFILIISIIVLSINTYAHSGRTDSSGGHKDNKNKSGLGNYHYHCGGHEAHLHTDGICPYDSIPTSASTTTTSSEKSTQEEITFTKPTTIDVTKVEINERIESIIVGEEQKLTVTITPNNATDQQVTWESSNEEIAMVNSDGNIIAKKAGSVEIVAVTSNGEKSSIMINVKEDFEEENNTDDKAVTNTIINNNTIDVITDTNTTTSNNTENSSSTDGILGLAVIGGGYLAYKKYKKTKE